MNVQELNQRSHISIFLNREEADRLRLILDGRRALGDWLTLNFDWQHFCTLTFTFPMTEPRAHLEFKRWIRSLERRLRHGVGWFVVFERGTTGLLHVHALLVHTSSLHVQTLASTWKQGRADVSVYDPSLGATHYLTKDVWSGVVEYSHDIALPHQLVRRHDLALELAK